MSDLIQVYQLLGLGLTRAGLRLHFSHAAAGLRLDSQNAGLTDTLALISRLGLMLVMEIVEYPFHPMVASHQNRPALLPAWFFVEVCMGQGARGQAMASLVIARITMCQAHNKLLSQILSSKKTHIQRLHRNFKRPNALMPVSI